MTAHHEIRTLLIISCYHFLKYFYYTFTGEAFSVATPGGGDG